MVQYSVYMPTIVLMLTIMAAPSMGPINVNHPPSKHMIRISREKVQKSKSGNTEPSRVTKRIQATPPKNEARIRPTN